MGSESYHEPVELLSEETRNLHRGIITLIEEFEAVDWYQQRAQACTDTELTAVLIHNRNEEMEHAMMTLEWLRRHIPELDAHARTYLFTDQPITRIEAAAQAGSTAGSTAGSAVRAEAEAPPARRRMDSLGVGSLLRARSAATE